MGELVLGVVYVFILILIVGVRFKRWNEEEQELWDNKPNYIKAVIHLINALRDLIVIVSFFMLIMSDISSLIYYWMIIGMVIVLVAINALFYMRRGLVNGLVSVFSHLFIMLFTIYICFNGVDVGQEKHVTMISAVKTVESYRSRFFNTDEVKLDDEEYSIKDIKILEDIKQCLGKPTELMGDDYFLYGLKNGMSNRVLVNVSCK